MDEDGEQPSSFLFETTIYKYLDIALDCGIKEADFWDMTLAELERYLLSWQRKDKQKSQEKAAYDYILAALIGKNVASYFGDVSIPEMTEVYSHLFQDQAKAKQEEKQKAKAELSALRFKQFATSFNKQFKKQEVAKTSE